MKMFLFSLCMLLTAVVVAQSSQARISAHNLGKGNIAIQGYDPVAYFTQHKAVAGKKELLVSFEGILYQFSSAENKELFKKNPAMYKPQYGGWCAYAMGASGEKVEIDPGTFKIKDGKLFLFYNKYFNNTLKSWEKDEANLYIKAELNWVKIAH